MATITSSVTGKLIEVLLTSKYLNKTVLEDVKAREKFFGGAFSTNLLEAGVLTEELLLQALNQACPSERVVSKLEIDSIEDKLTNLFPVNYVKVYKALPFSLDVAAETLTLLVDESFTPETLEKLRKVLFYKVKTVLTYELRFHYALLRLYHLPLPPRYQELLLKLENQAPLAFNTPVEVQQSVQDLDIDLEIQVTRRINRERDEILANLCNQALTHLQVALVLILKNGRVEVFKSTRAELLNTPLYPLREVPLLQEVYESGKYYLGALVASSDNRYFLENLKLLGLGGIFLAPIVIGEKVGAIFCAAKDSSISLQEVLPLQKLLTESGKRLEELILTQKQEFKAFRGERGVEALRTPLADVSAPREGAKEPVSVVKSGAFKPESSVTSFKNPESNNFNITRAGLSTSATASFSEKSTGEQSPKVASTPMLGEIEQLLLNLNAKQLEVRSAAIARLFTLGAAADRELSQIFPGEIAFNPLTSLSTLPAFKACNGLLELLALRGLGASNLVIPHLLSKEPLKRFFAVYYLLTFHYPSACELLAKRLYDPEPNIRFLALEALRKYKAEPGYFSLIENLLNLLRLPLLPIKINAVQVLGQLREISAFPTLINLLKTAEEKELLKVTALALKKISGQNLGSKYKKWQKWWHKNRSLPRQTWLFNALSDNALEVRELACKELELLVGSKLNFNPTDSKKERLRRLADLQVLNGRYI